MLGDSLIYGVGGLFVRASQVFILPIILLYLTPKEFGVLDYFLSIKNILIILYGWGILTAIFKFSNKNELRDSTPFNGIIIILFISILGGVLFYLISYFTGFFKQYTTEVILVQMISALGALLTVPLSVFRFRRRPINYIVINISYTLFLLVSSYILIVHTNYNYRAILIGHLLASSISFFIGIVSIRKYILLRVDTLLIKRMADFGLSILINSLAFVILFGTSRFFLKAAGSFTEVGLLGMAQRISLFVGALLISPFALAWLPFVRQHSDDFRFPAIANKVFSSFLWIGLFLGLTLELFQKDILLLIGNKSYLPALQYVLPFSFIYLLQGFYFIFSAGIFLSGNSRQYKIIGTTAILINLVLYTLLYHSLTLELVVFVTLLSFFYSTTMAYYFGNSRIKINILRKRNLMILLIYLLIFGILFSLKGLLMPDTVSYPVLLIKIGFILSLFIAHISYEVKVHQ